jgi:predicted N-acetyltransferase YhbS
MPAAISIRPVEAHELGFISDLSFRSYATLFEVTGGKYQGIDFAETAYAAMVMDMKERSAHADVFVAVTADGTIVGAVDYHNAYAEQPAPGFAKLAVDPNQRKGGIAEQLVRWCMARACDQGSSKLLLHTTDIMPGAQRLYKKLGFVRFPEIDFTAQPSGTFVMGFEVHLQNSSSKSKL